MEQSFGSTCHGAGRRLSRTAAIKATRGRKIHEELAGKGILARVDWHNLYAVSRDGEKPDNRVEARGIVPFAHDARERGLSDSIRALIFILSQ